MEEEEDECCEEQRANEEKSKGRGKENSSQGKVTPMFSHLSFFGHWSLVLQVKLEVRKSREDKLVTGRSLAFMILVMNILA